MQAEIIDAAKFFTANTASVIISLLSLLLIHYIKAALTFALISRKSGISGNEMSCRKTMIKKW